MAILFHNQDINFKLTKTGFFKKWIKGVITAENFIPGTINIIFCSDYYLLDINKKFLKHDFYTDIVTFNFNSENVISGDLIISIDRVKENANTFKVNFDDEIKRIIVHGILHLCGYEDKNKKLKMIMTTIENKYLNLF